MELVIVSLAPNQPVRQLRGGLHQINHHMLSPAFHYLLIRGGARRGKQPQAMLAHNID
jgi:hypothetical protein